MTTYMEVEERKVAQPCGCGSWMAPVACCDNCETEYCRQCVAEHQCRCTVDNELEPLEFCCGDCEQFLCMMCLPAHGCQCAVCGEDAARTPCHMCGLLVCEKCINHPCECDCGSGLRGVLCERCDQLYCGHCIGPRHTCDCQCGSEKLGNRYCAQKDVDEVMCADCFPEHECTCLCKELQGIDLPHCRGCGLAFCAKCVNSPRHECTCGNCSLKVLRAVCMLCSRIFCNACIDSHPCSCDSSSCDTELKYSLKARRKFCFDCLHLYCGACYDSHVPCTRPCQVCQAKPMLYRCACKAELCEDDLAKHTCKIEEIRNINAEKTIGNNNNVSPVTSCGKTACRSSIRVVTWNMNHIAKTTRSEKKTEKTAMIQRLCLNELAEIDILALQEVNSTAVDVLESLGDSVGVKEWGPLLVSKSDMTRTEFVRFFPATKPQKPSSVDEFNEIRSKLYPSLESVKGLLGEYTDWCQYVATKKTAWTKKTGYEELLKEVKEKFPKAEALYEQYGSTRYRYREFYPLVCRKDAPITINKVYVLWSNGSTTDVKAPKQEIVFRSPDAEAEFRPVVVYEIVRSCNEKNCPGHNFSLGLVHTSPDGNQFERIKIYEQQLKGPFEFIAQRSDAWIVVGDYYLASEAIVTRPDVSYAQLHRNTLKVTLKDVLPKRLSIVAALSGTNGGTWRSDTLFESTFMQVADFGICTTDFVLRRGFSLHPDTGRPMIVDDDHEGFQLLKTDDTSDHSPVLIFVAKEEQPALNEMLVMLGYTQEGIDKAKKSLPTKDPSSDTTLMDLHAQKIDLANQVKEAEASENTAFLTRSVNAYLKCLERIINRTQRPQGMSVLDYLPVKNCGTD